MMHGKLSNLTLQLPDPDFYQQDTFDITRQLLGMYLVRKNGRKQWIGKIVEVEAYIGENDPASHAFRGITPRTTIMFGPPGYAYVYFTYGMHFMLNVVTGHEGFPAAVLIRAIEPVSGFSNNDPFPGKGPGKLCKSMNIDRELNGISLMSKQLWIAKPPAEAQLFEVRWSTRIGISVGTDKIWRAYIYGNPHVSRKSNPNDPLEPSSL
jgi:DNA-3-methyladenine glycosylase